MNDGAAPVLGTAQLGIAYGYGLTNDWGMPGDAEAHAILAAAVEAGVRCLDTARIYGCSEERIGAALDGASVPPIEIVTKLDALDGLSDGAEPAEVEAAVDASVAASAAALRRSRLDVVLLHRERHLRSHRGAIWSRLRALRDDGRIDRIGVSVTTVTGLLAALSDRDVDHVQMSCNIVDHRWWAEEVQAKLRSSPAVVHGRSSLLQGLLVADEGVWRAFVGPDAEAVVSWLRRAAGALGRPSVLDLCVAYARSVPWLDGVVLGVESVERATGLSGLFNTALLRADEMAWLHQSAPRLPEAVLDTSGWPRGTALRARSGR